jgi:hypothetical protein
VTFANDVEALLPVAIAWSVLCLPPDARLGSTIVQTNTPALTDVGLTPPPVLV